jgi:adenosylcobinamide kinase / adenosylcobinamide-phosphate guanylyltransferase
MSVWITIVGGAKSGKTDFAAGVCEMLENVIWWGTAVEIPQDPDWQDRLQLLRSARKKSFITLEGPAAWPLGTASTLNVSSRSVFVLDSLNLWLAAQIQNAVTRYSHAQLRTHLEIEFQQLLKALKQLPCSVVVVTAEAGSGVVPSGEAGRLFRELIGQWNQIIAGIAHFGITMQCGQALLWPAGSTPVSKEGDPVRRVNKTHVHRLLSQV